MTPAPNLHAVFHRRHCDAVARAGSRRQLCTGRPFRHAGIVCLSLLLGACADYRPKPLPAQPDLEKVVPHVQIDTARLPRPQLFAHAFDPADGLDMTEIAQLAVLNDPELRAQRLKARVASAQVFSARLLPDPQLSLSADHPTGSATKLFDAYGLGLDYDIKALVTRPAAIDEAKASARKVDLEILWQEWQVIQQARILYVSDRIQARKLILQKAVRNLYAERYRRSAKALSQGNLTADVTGTDLTALMDADSQVDRLARQLDKTRHALNALLGLRPDVRLDLSELLPPDLPDAAHVREAIRLVSRRRPDLLALQAGYASQEAAVRRAILAQFPSLSVGFNNARDTSNVHTVGLGISLSLPVFNRNRGDIAVQRATREQLRAEYQLRLDKSIGQADELEKQAALIAAQKKRVLARLPDLERLVRQTRKGYETQDVGALTYLNMENTLLNKRLELLDLEQALWETRIALDTVLALPPGEHTKEQGR